MGLFHFLLYPPILALVCFTPLKRFMVYYNSRGTAFQMCIFILHWYEQSIRPINGTGATILCTCIAIPCIVVLYSFSPFFTFSLFLLFYLFPLLDLFLILSLFLFLYLILLLSLFLLFDLFLFLVLYQYLILILILLRLSRLYVSLPVV